MHIWPSYICYRCSIVQEIVRFGQSISSLWASMAGWWMRRCWCTYFLWFLMLVVEYIESSSLFGIDAPALWLLSLVETWKCCFLWRKSTLRYCFFLWHLGAWSLLDFPCFCARSWGFHSLFPMVGSHWFVMLPVELMVGWFHLVETSTVWWLVPCSLLIFFPIFVYLHSPFCECDCAFVVTHYWDGHEGILDDIEYICYLRLFR